MNEVVHGEISRPTNQQKDPSRKRSSVLTIQGTGVQKHNLVAATLLVAAAAAVATATFTVATTVIATLSIATTAAATTTAVTTAGRTSISGVHFDASTIESMESKSY